MQQQIGRTIMSTEYQVVLLLTWYSLGPLKGTWFSPRDFLLTRFQRIPPEFLLIWPNEMKMVQIGWDLLKENYSRHPSTSEGGGLSRSSAFAQLFLPSLHLQRKDLFSLQLASIRNPVTVSNHTQSFRPPSAMSSRKYLFHHKGKRGGRTFVLQGWEGESQYPHKLLHPLMEWVQCKSSQPIWWCARIKSASQITGVLCAICDCCRWRGGGGAWIYSLPFTTESSRMFVTSEYVHATKPHYYTFWQFTHPAVLLGERGPAFLGEQLHMGSCTWPTWLLGAHCARGWLRGSCVVHRKTDSSFRSFKPVHKDPPKFELTHSWREQ